MNVDANIIYPLFHFILSKSLGRIWQILDNTRDTTRDNTRDNTREHDREINTREVLEKDNNHIEIYTINMKI